MDRPYLDHAPASPISRSRTQQGFWAPMELAPGTVLFAPESVIACVARAFQVRAEDVTGPSKQANFCEARAVCFWLLRRHSRLPLKALGAALGRRDHTTPLRAWRFCEERRQTDAWFRGFTDELERELEEKAKAA